jgi:hypothetical protein
MTNPWTPKDTTTHQDHVIAHVLGATFLGYFVFAEALYILLDIGFIWTVLLDGEMGLLPHPVALSELEMEADVKEQIKADIELLLNNNAAGADDLIRMKLPPLGDEIKVCRIEEVSFFADGDERRLIITGDEAGVVIETSLATTEVQVMTVKDDATKGAEGAESGVKLEDVAKTEHEYLHQRLREDLGREPTEEELDQWLRQHTEGY